MHIYLKCYLKMLTKQSIIIIKAFIYQMIMKPYLTSLLYILSHLTVIIYKHTFNTRDYKLFY